MGTQGRLDAENYLHIFRASELGFETAILLFPRFRIDPAVVRTVPIVAALMTSLTMMCLGPPRQILGFSNVDETCPLADKQVRFSLRRASVDNFSGMGFEI